MRVKIGQHIAGGCLFLVAVASFSLSDAEPQQGTAKTEQRKQEAPFTFQVPVDVVIVSATVLDKRGNPVKDLTAADFRVYDDGKLQTLNTFSLQSYKATTEIQRPGPQPPGIVPAAPAPAPSPEGSRARFLIFFVDDLLQPSIELYHPAVEAIRAFISGDLRPGDQVAMTAASGQANYPFSSNQATLLNQAEELEKKLNHRPVRLPICPELSDFQASRIVDQMGRISPEAPEYSLDDAIRVALYDMLTCDTDVRLVYETRGRGEALIEAKKRLPPLAQQYVHEKEFRVCTLLTSLRQCIASLRFYEGNKSLILLTGGYYSPGALYVLQEAIDKALRCGVAINTLDIRGVYTTNITAAESTIADYSTIAQKTAFRATTIQMQEQSLAQLAEDTGGSYIHGTNDLHIGITQIAERQAYSYVLSYALPNVKNDGRYHKIKLEVDRPDVQVSYRKGYYARREEISFVRRKREDVLEALRAPGDISSIPIQLSYSSFRLDDSRYQLSIQIQVDIRSIPFAREEERHDDLIHIVTVASDENGRVVDGLEKAIDFRLTEPSYRNMLKYGLNSHAEINVPPGRYKLQAVVRESNQAKMGSLSKLIEVP